MSVTFTILIYALLTLTALKLAWNLGVPFHLLTLPKGSSCSMMLLLEWLLLGIAIGLSAATPGASWVHRPGMLALWGAVSIVASYGYVAVLLVAMSGTYKRKGSASSVRL